MKQYIQCIILFSAISFSSISIGNTRHISLKCDNNYTDYGMQMCMAKRYKIALKREKTEYKEAIKLAKRDDKDDSNQASPTTLSLVKASQQAWLKYQDNYCKRIAYIYYGGTMQPLEFAACASSLANDRADALETANNMETSGDTISTLNPDG